MSASQNQDGRQAGARSLTRRPGLRRKYLWAFFAIMFVLPLQLLGVVAAQAATFTPLTLMNGWSSGAYSTSTAEVADVSGIVHLSGAISGGSSAAAFTLPPGFRPATMVYVPVDMCNAHNGRLEIFPSGLVEVWPEEGFNQATCFTSLDGASFAQSASGFTPLALKNGWKNAPYSTSKAAARVISGIVYLKGAITGGASGFAFTLPPGFRPATNVYVRADLCNAHNGALDIHPNGAVSVQAEGGAFKQARCFTSLDGVSFAKSASGFTPLALQNGWQNAPIGTSNAAVRLVNGIVQFKGAIAGGANDVVFILPHGFRPVSNVYIPVDVSGGGKGRLDITPLGVVTLEAEGGYQQAQQFTSLDGASFNPGVGYAIRF